MVVLFGVTSPVWAQEKVFTPSELATYDGQNGHPAYFAYKGKVYDVTNSSLWKLGEHFGVHAGKDLTGMMAGAPHGDEVMSRVPLIGTYQSAAPAPVATVTPIDSPTYGGPVELVNKQPWYASPLRPFGMSILGWTGLLLGIVFVLNFATCFALPWSKFNLPWVGSRPGPDPLDASGTHMKWTMLHKYFAWATVVIGIIHGILGFLQVFFKLYL
jgi:predicted heme/steroid binding protein